MDCHFWDLPDFQSSEARLMTASAVDKLSTEASILGGGGGGQTYRFAPPPNNFDNLKNSQYVMQE